MTLIAIKTRMTHGPLRMQPPKPEVNVSYNFSRNVTKTSQMSLNRRNGDINRDRCHGIAEIVTVCPVSLWGPGTPESNHTCRLLLVPVAPCKNANVDQTVFLIFSIRPVIDRADIGSDYLLHAHSRRHHRRRRLASTKNQWNQCR